MGNGIQIDSCSTCRYEKMPLLLESLTKEELIELLADRKIITFYPGEVIFKQGTALTHFACFYKGKIKVYFERSDGSNMLINIIKEGHLSSGMGLFTDAEHHLTYQALTEVTVCFISLKYIQKLMLQNNEMCLALLKQKQFSIINLTNKIANLTFKNITSRVADVLLFLQNDIYRSKSFDLELSRKDMADLAAMSKGSFCHSLKEIMNSGIIHFTNNYIRILKEDALIKISNPEMKF